MDRLDLARQLVACLKIEAAFVETLSRVKATIDSNNNEILKDSVNHLESRYRENKKGFIEGVARIYAGIFNQEDLHTYLEFMKTPVGQKFIEYDPVISHQKSELMKRLFKG